MLPSILSSHEEKENRLIEFATREIIQFAYTQLTINER
jgi:hypothetical protein